VDVDVVLLLRGDPTIMPVLTGPKQDSQVDQVDTYDGLLFLLLQNSVFSNYK
jgi:hypothetical protein